MTTIYPNFSAAITHVEALLRNYASDFHGIRWQSLDVSKKPDARIEEVLNVSLQVSPLFNPHVKEEALLEVYRRDIKPNLPWADGHFEERVGGEPLNPGKQWRNWPWALAADKHRTESTGFENMFSHTYMERYWPKNAAEPLDGPHQGIRYAYGDLDDVVNHLLADPLSRQAYLPVWFPEDTGAVHGERVPCSLGYHWIYREGYLHTTYYIRSCDFYRHFRDDLYLTLRLTLWMLGLLKGKENIEKPNERTWCDARLGLFSFHCVSMHMFVNDWHRMFGKKP